MLHSMPQLQANRNKFSFAANFEALALREFAGQKQFDDQMNQGCMERYDLPFRFLQIPASSQRNATRRG
jgi:hypothetical protein